MSRRRPWLVAVGVGLGVLTGCGTTVSPSQVAVAGVASTNDSAVGNTDGLGGPGGTVGADAPGRGSASAVSGVAAAGQVSASSASMTAVGPGSPTASMAEGAGAGAAAAPATAVGVTPTQITIGYRYYTDDSSFAESFGLRGAQNGDQQGYARAVVADINAQGGVAGRKLSVVYSGETAQDAIYNADASDQSACSAFTEDNHIFAALSVGQGSVLHACLSQHHVPFIEDNFGLFDLSQPALAYNYFVPSQPTGPRSMQLLVNSLYANQWFGDKPVIGAVESDKGNRASSVAALNRALHSHHLELRANVAYATPQQLSEALLQMQADGVNRLFVVEGSNGLETEVVMTQAQSQHYFPEYAIDTRSGPSFLQLNAPPQQMHGAAGIGWFPMYDVGVDTTPRAKQCLDLIHHAGYTTPDPLAVRFALSTCDVFDFFRVVMSRVAGISAAGFIDAANALHGAFEPVGSFTSWLSPTQHDGMSAFESLVYVDSCRCFRYSGPLVRTS